MTAIERAEYLVFSHDLVPMLTATYAGRDIAVRLIAKAIETAEREAVTESTRRCAAIIRDVIAPPVGDAMADAFIKGDLIFGRIDVIKDAILEEREACAKLLEDQNVMVNQLLGEHRHDAFVRDVTKAIRKRGQS